MRYQITLINGEQWATDFEPGDPIRRPDGVELYPTIIASRSRNPITMDAVNVAIGNDTVLTIIDNDCG